MKSNRSIYIAALGTLLLASAPSAYAQTQDKIDCLKLNVHNCRTSISIDPEEVRQCVMRGYDAPISCRKKEGKSAGVRVEGSSGFSYGTIQAPEDNPGRRGANPTVDLKKIGQSFGYPPWPGAPCILPGGINLCVPGGPTPSTDPVDPNCPEKSDNSGLFGEKKLLTSASVAMPCGAAVPLTTYELTLNKNSDRLASTEHGSYFIWFYRNSGNIYSAVSNPNPPSIFNPNPPPILITNPDRTAFQLPTYLCRGNGGPKSVDLTPPIAQMITYNAATSSLFIRLKGRENLNPVADPALIPPYNPDDPEKYLVIPVVNGTAQVPGNCADADTYWKTIDTIKVDMIVDAGSDGGCEAPAELCALVGTPTVPAPTQSCEVATIPLTGACDKKTQYVILDRTNLVYPPETSAVSMIRISNRTAMMAPSVNGSHLYTKSSETIRLGTTAPVVTLPEGGVLLLANGSSLRMSAPATINVAGNSITMTSGGVLNDAGGSLVQSYGGGATYSPGAAAGKLWTIQIERSMSLPAGYMLPTQPSPYAQFPAVDD